MKKYMLAFFITIPMLLVVWNMVDSAEKPKNTYNGTVKDSVDTYEIESTVEMLIEISNEVLLTQKIKEHLQNNELSGFTFQESEKALCYYMGINNDFPNMYVFAICKEALNGDIVHERTIYIAKETGHLYAKDNETLIELNVDVPKGMQLPDVTRKLR